MTVGGGEIFVGIDEVLIELGAEIGERDVLRQKGIADISDARWRDCEHLISRIVDIGISPMVLAGIGASVGLPRPVVGIIRSSTLQRLPALEN